MKTTLFLHAAGAAFVFAAHAGGFSVSTSTKLEADADWRGKGVVTVSAGATLDLAGRRLSLSGIAGAGTITDTAGGGVLYVYVPEGVSAVNTNVSFAGSLRFVKAGAGDFRQACMGHSYGGGTLVAAGALRCKAGDLNSEPARRLNWGRPGTEILVERGATLDLRDSCNNCYWNIVLDGGRLLLRDSRPNPASDAQVQNLKLLADSSMEVCDSGFIGSGYGRCRIGLNDHRLTVNCVRGHAAYLFNTTFVSSGSLRFATADGSSVLIDKVPVDEVPKAGAFFDDDIAKSTAVIPAPREMRLTGGVHWARKPPKTVKAAGIPPEGYEISITPDGITIRHSDDAGAYYANMTLSQMGRWDAKKKCKVYPGLEIKDSPKFRWRGVHIDDSRHFLGKDVVMHIIEQMSWFKFNVLHWHLIDDQYWTLEIPGYPELQQYGGECLVAGQSRKYHGEKVSPGIYTANDVKEIVEYAKARHITVVPEVEFPGHSVCALCAYPQLSCDPQYILKRGRDPSNFGGGGDGVFCIGNPESIRFLEKVLDHVCEIFPSEVIHIGGDECPRTFWEKCPKCQAFVKREGLTGIEQIQPWVTRLFTEYLAKKGKRAIGWDEIFIESKNRHVTAGKAKITSLLPKSTMGMCYRVQGAGAAAARQGYDVVMTPHTYTYFDYRQGLAEDPFMYFGGWLPLARVYQFDPLAGVDEEARQHIVGGQCCNWTSHTFYRYDLEWKLWPRGFAVAEVLWTYPDPRKRDFAGFSARAEECRRRLIAAHVNCAPLK